jgi:hypothetical protein
MNTIPGSSRVLSDFTHLVYSAFRSSFPGGNAEFMSVNPSICISIGPWFCRSMGMRHSGRRRPNSSNSKQAAIGVSSNCCGKAEIRHSAVISRISVGSSRCSSATSAGPKLGNSSAISYRGPAHGPSSKGICDTSPVAVDICYRRHRVWNSCTRGFRTVFAGSRTDANACEQLPEL